tara:strand:+ start:377 stop:520 length:144 start_codon:yes stop_codon:yes gene_type:complete
MKKPTICPKCFGTGRIYDGKTDTDSQCDICHGTGFSDTTYNPLDDES